MDLSQTGIGIIQGWICDVNKKPGNTPGKATIEISNSDGDIVFGPFKVPYGSLRTDTKEMCKDSNNGFAMIMNWNLLLKEEGTSVTRYGPETFTVDLYVNDKWQDSSQIQVITMGEGVSKRPKGERICIS